MGSIGLRKRRLEDAAARGLIRSGDRARAGSGRPGVQLAINLVVMLGGIFIVTGDLLRLHPDWVLAAFGVFVVVSNAVLTRGRLKALRAGKRVEPSETAP